jgi:hypothetical protein
MGYVATGGGRSSREPVSACLFPALQGNNREKPANPGAQDEFGAYCACDLSHLCDNSLFARTGNCFCQLGNLFAPNRERQVRKQAELQTAF